MSETLEPGAGGAVEVRRLHGLEELATAARLFHTAMVGLPSPGLPPEAWVAELYEPERAFGAFVDGRLIGTTDSYTSVLLAPGGAELRHAAVTHVGVLPTHTRRGAATAMLRRQLIDARERGEVVASLRASDARIYERFGFAAASSSARIEVEREAAGLRSGAARSGGVRFIDADDTWPLLERIYARQPAGRAGWIARPDYWWRQQRLRRQGAAEPAYVAVSGAPGLETGFVRYHPVGVETWFSGTRRTVVVDDVVAHGADAYGALIGHLLSLDLVHVLVFASRPVDDPLPELVEDRRAVRVADIRDETWLRLLDVPAALSARSYAGRGEVVLEVADPLIPENLGRFRISPEGVTQTSAPANARADVSALAAAYLGGTRWWQLHQAGRVEERDAGAVATLDSLFAVEKLPHGGTMF